MNDYPLIGAAGLTINTEHDGPPGVTHDELHPLLKDRGLLDAWHDFAYGSTMGPNGGYPWDVERFLNQHAR